MDGPTCASGCGRPAVATLKNGKPICAASPNSCPVMRQRNGANKRGRDPWAGRAHPRGMAGKVPWNKGRRIDDLYDAETAQRIREATRRGIARTQEVLRASPDIEARRRTKLSAIARERRLGQYRRGSGRGKKGWYKGHWCDSSYELAFIIYALDHGLAFERNLRAFPYTFEGRSRHWIPDFRLTDGTYLEIKGYVSPQAEAKFAAFPHPLIVICREHMQFVFDYVVQTYGKNFTRLYE
jgi:hypothetical protein